MHCGRHGSDAWRCFRGAAAILDFDDELQTHLQLATDELVARGVDGEEARRRAAVAIGGFDAAREGHRDARGLPLLESAWADVRYGVRRLIKAPAFTLCVAVILAVGIGANTAMFSVVNAIVLRPLPFAAADRLVWIAPDTRDEGMSARTYPIRFVEEMQRNSSTLDGVTGYFAFFGFASYTLTGRGDAERLIGVPVGPQFFEMLGVTPAMGRGFSAQELAPNGPQAALITHATWQRTFAGNAAIVGQTVTLGGQPVTVVGVLPATFDFGSVFVPGTRVDMFVPANYEQMREWGNVLAVVGRLAPGASLEAARAEFRSLMPRIGTNLGTFRGQMAVITPLDEHVNGRIERSLLVLWGAAGLVLLIACANLAGLLLARTSARSKEIAVRLALGASRSRIVRQIVTESTVLSVIGACLGIPLAYALVSYLKSLPGLSLPLLHRVEVDGMALLFTALVAVGSGVAFGLLPARRIASGDSQQSMRDQTRGSTRGRGHARLRSTLVVVEIALACVLLVGAGLLLRTFLRVQAVNLGFAPSQAFAMRVNTSADMDGKARHVLLREMLRRIRNAPGIEAAALSDGLPLDRNRTWSVSAPGREVRPGETLLAFVYITGPEFFKTMGMRLTSGRDLAETDRADSEQVMVVSESLARALYPGQDAVGRMAQRGPGLVRIVGVVSDIRQTSLETQGALHMYLPYEQVGDGGLDLIVRSSLPATSAGATVRRTIGELDPTLSATDLRSLDDLIERAISPRRFLVWLLGAFAVIALVLASLGIYSTVAFSVGERVREFGVRMALGATAADISRGVLAQTATLAAVGVTIGGLVSLWLARLMTALLYETSSTDVATFVLTALVLSTVAMVAGYVPAARAARVSPMAALRNE